MNLVAFAIPDAAELPAWLERRLVAPDFGRFVAELAAVFPDRGRSHVPARQLLGDWYRGALADGLGGVPIGVLQQLLRHPKCLTELQEAVLTEGGPHWDEVGNDAPTPVVERGRAKLEAVFGARSAAKHLSPGGEVGSRSEPGEGAALAEPAPSPAAARRPLPQGRGEAGGRSYRTWALASSALAACLLVAVGVLAVKLNKPGGTTPQPQEVASVGWGWAKPGGIPGDSAKPAEYLNGLAGAADEWFNKRPEDAAAVAKRINEFRAGCTQLIFSPHAPLAPKDREWLVERCRAWAKKLDDHLAALEAGGDPLKVRADADETVRKLQGALRERAAQV